MVRSLIIFIFFNIIFFFISTFLFTSSSQEKLLLFLCNKTKNKFLENILSFSQTSVIVIINEFTLMRRHLVQTYGPCEHTVFVMRSHPVFVMRSHPVFALDALLVLRGFLTGPSCQNLRSMSS